MKPIEQKILVIDGFPNPFKKRIIIKANPIMSPASFLYEIFNKEAIRKRKQKRWNKKYGKNMDP